MVLVAQIFDYGFCCLREGWERRGKAIVTRRRVGKYFIFSVTKGNVLVFFFLSVRRKNAPFPGRHKRVLEGPKRKEEKLKHFSSKPERRTEKWHLHVWPRDAVVE